MKRFGQHYRQKIKEDLDNLKFTGNEKKSKILQNGCSFFSKVTEKHACEGNTSQEIYPEKRGEEYWALTSLDGAEEGHMNHPGR